MEPFAVRGPLTANQKSYPTFFLSVEPQDKISLAHLTPTKGKNALAYHCIIHLGLLIHFKFVLFYREVDVVYLFLLFIYFCMTHAKGFALFFSLS